MDEMHLLKSECRIFDTGHRMNYDAGASSPDHSVWSCACGVNQTENEDAGTGA